MSQSDEVSTYSFLRGMVDLFSGPHNGVGLGVISGHGGSENVELSGKLPLQLKRGLPRVYANWEKPRRGWISWSQAFAVWHSTTNSYGPRFAVASLAELVELLVRRRELVAKRAL